MTKINTFRSRLECKVPPVAISLLCAVLIYFCRDFLSFPPMLISPKFIGAIFVVLGIMLALSGVVEFRKTKTTVDPLKPHNVSSLVSDGVYRFTRNPMYLGMLICLIGLVFYVASIAALIGPLFFIVYMNIFQITPEQVCLEDKFGDEYRSFLKRVPRWFFFKNDRISYVAGSLLVSFWLNNFIYLKLMDGLYPLFWFLAVVNFLLCFYLIYLFVNDLKARFSDFSITKYLLELPVLLSPFGLIYRTLALARPEVVSMKTYLVKLYKYYGVTLVISLCVGLVYGSYFKNRSSFYASSPHVEIEAGLNGLGYALSPALSYGLKFANEVYYSYSTQMEVDRRECRRYYGPRNFANLSKAINLISHNTVFFTILYSASSSLQIFKCKTFFTDNNSFKKERVMYLAALRLTQFTDLLMNKAMRSKQYGWMNSLLTNPLTQVPSLILLGVEKVTLYKFSTVAISKTNRLMSSLRKGMKEDLAKNNDTELIDLMSARNNFILENHFKLLLGH